MSGRPEGAEREIRRPAVAGAFYPADPARLRALVRGLLETAAAAAGVAKGGDLPAGPETPAHPRAVPAGILVPHAGLVYSGAIAAAGWRLLDDAGTTAVILGTNHSVAFSGIAAWTGDAWATPLGDVAVDVELAATIVALGGPFGADRSVHAREHSIEVQLPVLLAAAPGARIVPLAVSFGIGRAAREAGASLGRLVAERRAAGERIILAISTDMAHYPPAGRCAGVTRDLLPNICGLDPAGLAAAEAAAVGGSVACGMCGIEPTVVGLAALRAMGARSGVPLAAATSADAGGDPARTVGYLAVRFD